MRVLILAGGAGTRLRDIVKDVPKPMAPVGGRPFMEYLLMHLRAQGIMDVIILTGYMGGVIRAYFGDGRRAGMRISYSEEARPLGTAGALLKAALTVSDEEFLVLNGDTFLDADFNGLVRFHKDKGSAATMAAVRVDNTQRYGRIVADKSGRVRSFIEKGDGSPGLINGGVLVIEKETALKIPPAAFSFEHEVLPGLLESGLYAMEVRGYFMDIGTPESYGALLEDAGKVLAAAGLSRRRKC